MAEQSSVKWTVNGKFKQLLTKVASERGNSFTLGQSGTKWTQDYGLGQPTDLRICLTLMKTPN